MRSEVKWLNCKIYRRSVPFHDVTHNRPMLKCPKLCLSVSDNLYIREVYWILPALINSSISSSNLATSSSVNPNSSSLNDRRYKFHSSPLFCLMSCRISRKSDSEASSSSIVLMIMLLSDISVSRFVLYFLRISLMAIWYLSYPGFSWIRCLSIYIPSGLPYILE